MEQLCFPSCILLSTHWRRQSSHWTLQNWTCNLSSTTAVSIWRRRLKVSPWSLNLATLESIQALTCLTRASTRPSMNVLNPAIHVASGKDCRGCWEVHICRSAANRTSRSETPFPRTETWKDTRQSSLGISSSESRFYKSNQSITQNKVGGLTFSGSLLGSVSARPHASAIGRSSKSTSARCDAKFSETRKQVNCSAQDCGLCSYSRLRAPQSLVCPKRVRLLNVVECILPTFNFAMRVLSV